MISIEKEEKLLKGLSVFPFLILIFINTSYSNFEDDVSISIFIGSVFLFCMCFGMLYIRKYKRDKKDKKDLSGYNRAFKWMGITILTGLGFVVFHLFNS